jgi:glycosyltransferase involved in cell wall biosynthesis
MGITGAAEGGGEAVDLTVAVVLPCLNEEMNLSTVLGSLPRSIDEVILVDGCSTDGSVECAQRLRDDIKIVHQVARGKGLALITGMMQVSSDIVIFLDADGSMRGEEIPDFLIALATGAALARGSRKLPGGGSTDFTWIRSAGNRLLTKIVNVLYGVRWTDLTYGYFALRMDAVLVLDLSDLIHQATNPESAHSAGRFRRILPYGHGFEIDSLIFCRAARKGLVVKEVPTFEDKRRHGTSKLHAFRDGVRVGCAVIRERISPGAAREASMPRVEPS